ncbi:hypothetical protein [Thiothrix nivea]|uniref:Lipoprotein n=1 Tax=Thiothrix nivea (strain ATCC 35100 / DSM 5205 / JP2) TaxID=870187 RepID=A0A656HDC3_THINJ|nr:hypothetical protein [Thiothrix nivea]EIJ34878.1 hypothetical protein Thini_2324 [Thiothrix nivea DSM 5205]
MQRLIFTLLCLPLLYACGHKPAADDHFPLQAGLRWEYQVRIEQPHRSASRGLLIRNLGEQTFKGATASVRQTSDGTDYYIARQTDGLYRIAKRSAVELQPQPDPTPRMVLPLPAAQSKGKTWSSVTMPYLIERVYEGGHNLYASGLRFPMTYTLVGVDEQVEVPAGRFSHCLLVEGQAELTLYADPRKGDSQVHVTTREWYAPGVGLVRLEREEPLDTDVYKGGKMTLELVEFDD